MSARDFFVVDEEQDAPAQEAYATWTGDSGNQAATQGLPESKELSYADQFGKEGAMRQFLVKYMLPFLVIALVLLVVASGDSAGVSDIPTPCRG